MWDNGSFENMEWLLRKTSGNSTLARVNLLMASIDTLIKIEFLSRTIENSQIKFVGDTFK